MAKAPCFAKPLSTMERDLRDMGVPMAQVPLGRLTLKEALEKGKELARRDNFPYAVVYQGNEYPVYPEGLSKRGY